MMKTNVEKISDSRSDFGIVSFNMCKNMSSLRDEDVFFF